VIEAVVVEPHQRVGRRRGLLPFVAFVPPGNDRGDVQVVGQHQQLDVFEWPMHVQIARPPTFLRHVDEPLDLHRLGVVGEVVDGEVAGAVEVLRPAFDLERIVAARQLELDLAVKHEMIVEEWLLGDALRLAGLVLQVHAAGDRLSRFGVDDGEREFAGGGLHGPGKCKVQNAKCKGQNDEQQRQYIVPAAGGVRECLLHGSTCSRGVPDVRLRAGVTNSSTRRCLRTRRLAQTQPPLASSRRCGELNPNLRLRLCDAAAQRTLNGRTSHLLAVARLGAVQ
jgi:hypothetical protein